MSTNVLYQVKLSFFLFFSLWWLGEFSSIAFGIYIKYLYISVSIYSYCYLCVKNKRKKNTKTKTENKWFFFLILMHFVARILLIFGKYESFSQKKFFFFVCTQYYMKMKHSSKCRTGDVIHFLHRVSLYLSITFSSKQVYR